MPERNTESTKKNCSSGDVCIDWFEVKHLLPVEKNAQYQLANLYRNKDVCCQTRRGLYCSLIS